MKKYFLVLLLALAACSSTGEPDICHGKVVLVTPEEQEQCRVKLARRTYDMMQGLPNYIPIIDPPMMGGR